jgi:hypothetical protein
MTDIDDDATQHASRGHNRPPPLAPIPPELGPAIFDVLARGAIVNTPGLALAVGSGGAGHGMLVRQVQAWCCDHPEILDHDGRGWRLRANAKRPELGQPAPVPVPDGDLTAAAKLRIEVRVRESLENKVHNQRRHMTELHGELERVYELLANAWRVDVDEAMCRVARLLREIPEPRADHSMAWARQDAKRSASPAPAPASTISIAPAGDGDRRRRVDYAAVLRRLGTASVPEIARAAGVSVVSAYRWVSQQTDEVLDVIPGRPVRYRIRDQVKESA